MIIHRLILQTLLLLFTRSGIITPSLVQKGLLVECAQNKSSAALDGGSFI